MAEAMLVPASGIIVSHDSGPSTRFDATAGHEEKGAHDLRVEVDAGLAGQLGSSLLRLVRAHGRRPLLPEVDDARAREPSDPQAGIDFDPQVVRAFLLVSRGRVNRVLGPLSWLTMIPLAAPAWPPPWAPRPGAPRTPPAAVVGAGERSRPPTALGIAGPVAGSAHLARPAPVRRRIRADARGPVRARRRAAG